MERQTDGQTDTDRHRQDKTGICVTKINCHWPKYLYLQRESVQWK